MTEQEFLKLITTRTQRIVLSTLAAIPEAERRKFAKVVVAAYEAHIADHTNRHTTADHQKAAERYSNIMIGMFATAPSAKFHVGLNRYFGTASEIIEIFTALRPSWADDWAEISIANSPHNFASVTALANAGLCKMPEGDNVILGYYATRDARDAAQLRCFTTDVWRFFEVEGGGQFSLAAHDKYAHPDQIWADILLEMSANGALDRDRLLDAALDAIARDFPQFVGGWYTRFATSLAPTPTEVIARKDRYLHLLGSAIGPTVGFAMATLKQLDKAKALTATELLPAIGPALQSRQKSTALAALALLKSVAAKDKSAATDIAVCAVQAMISETAEVQERALALITHLGRSDDPAVLAALAPYREVAAPSVQVQLGETPALPDTAYPVPLLETVVPVASAEEAVATYLTLLEDCRNPLLMERAMDGMARFAQEAAPLLAPLGKRAAQVMKRHLQGGYDAGKFYQDLIAAIGLAWATGTTADAQMATNSRMIWPDSYQDKFLSRADELLRQSRQGHDLPMLSLPTDNRGYLCPLVFENRQAQYRKSGCNPGPVDFRLALLRLAPENRAEALATLPQDTENERAFAYALGADLKPEKDTQLWAMAWSSRLPVMTEPKLPAIPGAGVPVALNFDPTVKRQDTYSWPLVQVTCPPLPDKAAAMLCFGAPYLPKPFAEPTPNPSWLADSSPWVGFLRPVHTELYLAEGINAFWHDDKLAVHPCLRFLDPFFRPELIAGPVAHALLAYYLVAADPAIGARATDALATLIAQGNFDARQFGQAANKLIFDAKIPLRRWVKRMTEVAAISASHAAAVRGGLEALIYDMPGDLPRDFGAILDLLYELSIATNTAPSTCLPELAKIKAGGKTGSMAKKLMAME